MADNDNIAPVEHVRDAAVVSTPTHFRIPVPQPIFAKRKGIDNVAKYGHAVLVRIDRVQYALIKRQSARLGVPFNSFMRWCAVAMAREIAKYHGEADGDVEL